MAFELFNLAGKRALVTGSSQGIGFAIARGLASMGLPSCSMDASPTSLRLPPRA